MADRSDVLAAPEATPALRPRLLDLFCGAGGCSVGYHRAGFDVVGIDIEDHPDYPYELVVHDAMDVLANWPRFLKGFDVIHASPPCQAYSTMTADHSLHPDLLPAVRRLLRRWGGIYVIENVEGAVRRHMHNPLRLCGSSFGLRVRRHRYFEANEYMWGLSCRHDMQRRPVGVYGDHPQNDHEYLRPDGTHRGAKATSISDAQDAMGIDWMTDWRDLTEAIPPAYTQFVGEQLLHALAVVHG